MRLLKGKESILIFLAENDAFAHDIRITTSMLAKQLNISQQTASRLLIQLEKEGYITRRIVGRETYVKLTENGMNELIDLHVRLKRIVEQPVQLSLEGRVFSGLGEGAYYIGLPGYYTQIKEKLGFEPFLGTLNIRLSSSAAVEGRILLEKAADIVIEGFKDEKRSYGSAKCIKALFNDKDECAILFIERTHHDASVIEVVAPYNLRERYGLKDGDKVKLTVSLQPILLFSNLLGTSNV
jgi:riboflavin kinase